MNKTGGGIPKLWKLTEMEERIVQVTNMRGRAARIEESNCIGIPESIQTNVEVTEPSKCIINELPETHQDQLISADTNDLDQTNIRKYSSDESIENQSFKVTQEPAAKKTKRNAELTQQEFQKLILKQNDETNRLLTNISNNFETFVSATFAHYNEILKLNKNKPN